MGANKSKQGGKFYKDGQRQKANYLGQALDQHNAHYNSHQQSPRASNSQPSHAARGVNTQRPSPRTNYNSSTHASAYNSSAYHAQQPHYKSNKAKTNGKKGSYYKNSAQHSGGALALDPADDRNATQMSSMQKPYSSHSNSKYSQRGAYNSSNTHKYVQNQVLKSKPLPTKTKPPSLPAYKFRDSSGQKTSSHNSNYRSAYPSKSSGSGGSHSTHQKPYYQKKSSSSGHKGSGELRTSLHAGSSGTTAYRVSHNAPKIAKSNFAQERQTAPKYAAGSQWTKTNVISEDAQAEFAIPEEEDAQNGRAMRASGNRPGFKMNKKMTIDDFVFLKVVGKGSFGKVMQVRYKKDGKIYAMKVLKKKALVKRKQVIHTRTERRVVAAVNNPFIVSLQFAFQTPAKLYMILDFFNGGELFFHLKKEGRFSERRAKFYGAEITSALGALHALNIVYRDLKPENILLDQDGHIKITDFGLSKDSIEADELTHTFCGTPEYLAPEVLQQQGHGKAVDWWSFGTLLYEMMTGLPPFYNQNLNIMYEKILHAPIKMPTYLSKESRSLFRGLLERNPAKRLASGPGDADEIKVHPYFRDIDWPKLETRQVKPPFKPPVANERQTHMFETEFTDLTPKDTPVVTSSSMLKAQGAFPGFTYDHVKDTSAFGDE